MRFMIIVGCFELFKESANRFIRGSVDRFDSDLSRLIRRGLLQRPVCSRAKREGGRGELSFR